MDFTHLATQEPKVSFESSSESKELVRQAIDIVDLVGKYIRLRRQGRHYVGLCPWHDDSRPSLQVNPDRQSFKCWVCDIGGDVFTFMMKMEGVEFPEALAMLADQAGIALKPTRSAAPAVAGSPQDKRTLYRVMAWAERQYHHCLLHDPDAEPARNYLRERGIAAESIEKYQLGFCPNRWDWLQQQARNRGPNDELLEAVGLLARSESGGRPYDRFRGRVLFSIRDVQARPIGVGGRVLPESGNTSPAKYVNSPETPLFRKSENLYGLDVARESIRKSGTALVMEGYTDCIVANQFGFGNAVAVLGTALGEGHIRILKRFCDRIVLVLDGDEAGRKRANEVLELFIAANVDLRIVTLPDDLDPCDFLIERGADAFRDALEQYAVDALDHAFVTLTRGVDLVNDIHRSSEALEKMLAIVAKAPRLRPDSTHDDRFREERILQRLAQRFRIAEGDVRERLIILRRGRAHAVSRAALGSASGSVSRSGGREDAADGEAGESSARPMGRMDVWQRELLELLIRFPELLPAARASVRPEQMEYEPCRRIYQAICDAADLGREPTFERLMLDLDDPGVKSLLVELDETGAAKKIPDSKVVLEELLRSFRDRETTRQKPIAIGMLREKRLDEDQALDLLQSLVQQQRTRHGISGPTDG